MEQQFITILAVDLLAIVGLLGIGARFIASQSARITSTEHRLAALETAQREAKAQDTESDSRYIDLVERLARLEERVDRIIRLLEARE